MDIGYAVLIILNLFELPFVTHLVLFSFYSALHQILCGAYDLFQ